MGDRYTMLTLDTRILFLVALALFSAGCAEPDPPSISLYRAVHVGDLDQVDRHIHWGADLNEANPDGEMPLHVAARSGRVAITRLLIRQGADLDVANRDGRTPIYVALMAGRTQAAKLLYESGAALDADNLLHEVARNRIADRDVIAFLTRHGGNINNVDASGSTALHTAVDRGFRVVSKVLISRGADVNALDRNGHSPLKLAMENNNPDLIVLLQRNGAVMR
jgi:ankyrin repeat protein